MDKVRAHAPAKPAPATRSALTPRPCSADADSARACGAQPLGNQALQRAARAAGVQRTAAPALLQRQCAACAAQHEGDERLPDVQPARGSGNSGSGVLDEASANEVVAVQRGGGAPLAPAQRAYFEPRFGRDFGDVRVHTGDRAARSAQSLAARAYTAGSDVVFAAGEFTPDSSGGRKLLAHELAHIVQQRAGVRLKGGIGVDGDEHERQADAVAERVAAGRSARFLLRGLHDGRAAPARTPVQRNGADVHATETKSAFAARVHAKAIDRLTRNIGALDRWADYIGSMQGFQLQAQLLTGMAVEFATVAAPTPAGRERFETFASTHNDAERDFEASRLDVDAPYRERSGSFMGFLASQTQGHWTSPSVAEGLQVIAGDRSRESLAAPQWVPADPRYSEYAGAIRRFQSGESGGCQTCHDINFAWQRTAERWGDPLPRGDLFSTLHDRPLPGGSAFGGGALSSGDREALGRFITGLHAPGSGDAAAPSATLLAAVAPPVATDAAGATGAGGAAAAAPNPFVPDTPLPKGVETPPARTDLCGMLPPAEDAERNPDLASWGPGSAIVADVVRRLDAVLTPLGPRGYRVLGPTHFDLLYRMTPEGMEGVRDGIVARIHDRQGDYRKLSADIRAGSMPYEELCPIVDELLPSTNALVRMQALDDVHRWQTRELVLTVLELTLIALSFLVPPLAVVTVPAGIALGLARASLGFDQRRQGRQWSQAIGSGLVSLTQQAEAPGLVERGNKNIGFGLLSAGLSGLGTFRLVQEAAASARLMRALEEGAVITHAAYPGVRLLARQGRLLLITDTGEVLGFGMIRNGQLFWSPLRVPYAGAGGAADAAGTGSALVPAGPSALVPFAPGGGFAGTSGLVPYTGGGGPLLAPWTGGGGGAGVLAPWRTPLALTAGASRAPLLLGSGRGAFPMLTGGPRSPLLLAAPPYENFADLGTQLAAQPGSGFGESLVWSVTPGGTVFATPPLSGVPLYAPDAMLPPASYFAGGGQSRPWTLSGPLREPYTPFDVLPGQSATSRSLSQVRSARGPNLRGTAGEQHIAELSGGEREVTLQLPADLARRSDVISPTIAGGVNQEVKNYLRYIGRGGPAREVPWSRFMQTEIDRDAMIMFYYNQQAVWVFTDAPPSAALIQALDQAGIPYIIAADRLPLP
ncbi:DUF4157 domain-containing protein [Variovorax sp. J22R24]|uniref:DUF4157 domain-containing protein n=1 Tax=Variovorax gracilis TaxID=3053502 RepID=UPI002574BD38|nr:DUF4157 domain-containing protein [Variovorax sp. J22R24]MDM0109638.1 DUF4157 domain-containing protein [Variovorax sp. J22R24]